MKAENLSTSLGEGRDAAPSLAHPSPKTKPSRLHRRVDTPVNSEVRTMSLMVRQENGLCRNCIPRRDPVPAFRSTHKYV